MDVTPWKATMNISRVYVKGLFDEFDHDIAFMTGEQIMLVVGPNGSGKTTVLKLIDMLFNRSIGYLTDMPFREINVSFDDKASLIVKRIPVGLHRNKAQLTLTYCRNGASETFDLPRVSIDQEDRILIHSIEKFIPTLDRIGPQQWHDTETGHILDLNDVLTVFPDEFPPHFQRNIIPTPDWLQDIKDSVVVRFIDPERLTHAFRVSRRRRRNYAANPERTVNHYSKELANRIKISIAQYGTLSQSLDRTFPARLVADREHSNDSSETLREDLNTIEQKCSRLENVGLLAREDSRLKIPDLSLVDESQRGMLAVYARDAKEKLAVFDDLYEKTSAFKRIVNSRFSHKQVTVSEEGLHVNKEDGTNLDLEKLSSGEQHELVMLYELLFCASSNSLILIDEPEISLHVAWQEQWTKDLEEIARLSDFRAIVATHSPEIVGDRWHLTVEPAGRNGTNASLTDCKI